MTESQPSPTPESDRSVVAAQEAAQKPAPIDLKNAPIAALLAWLWPGAGHLYQGRFAKGALFMICILGTYFFGLWIGGGRCVYASWKPEDRRWQYFCQLGVGGPSLPAAAQSMLCGGETRSPFLVLCYREPIDYQIVTDVRPDELEMLIPDAVMAPPIVDPDPNRADMLAAWHKEFGALFEMGTLYTMIAGLLNVLAIYDAYAGPLRPADDDPKKRNGEGDKKKEKAS